MQRLEPTCLFPPELRPITRFNIPLRAGGFARSDAGGGLWAFELGNENQGVLTPAEAAERVMAVADALSHHWPNRTTRPLLVGPS
eukprot:5301505-Prymnesium_polylepis.2